jgi:hypothetical protein
METITINRNGNELQIIKDHFIYEVFYKSINLGYFHVSRIENAIREIVNNGFYDGRNYDLRIQNVNEGKAV